MQDTQSRLPEINALEAQAFQAARSGRDDEAYRLWSRILELDPNHVPHVVVRWASAPFAPGDMVSARVAFQRLVDTDGSDPQQWIHLAIACRNLKRRAGRGERDSTGAHPRPQRPRGPHSSRQPARATRQDARGRRRLQCGRRPSRRRSSACIRSFGRRSPRRTSVSKNTTDRGAFLDQYLDAPFRTFAGDDLKRFRDSVDIMVGRKRRHESHSTAFHYAGLAPIEFFDRALFPWLDRFEAATDDIRNGVPGRPRGRGRLHALHFLPAGRPAEPVRRAQQLTELERLPPVQDGDAGRRRMPSSARSR